MTTDNCQKRITLPRDLLDRGFTLIATAPGELFAVSERYGCTGIKAQIGDVIREARSIAGYCEWRSKQRMPPAPAVDIFPIGLNTSIGTANDDATD